MKELVSSDAPKRIKSIQFGVLSQQEIVDLSQLEVVDRSLYQQGVAERKATVGGPNDSRLVSRCGCRMPA